MQSLIVSLMVFSVAVLLTTTGASAEDPPAKPSIAGIWKWTFTMPDGSEIKPRLDLKVEDGELTGTTRLRTGTETAVTNLVLKGSQVSFDVVRQRDGQEVLTHYTGVWSNNVIRGKIDSNWSGQEQ